MKGWVFRQVECWCLFQRRKTQKEEFLDHPLHRQLCQNFHRGTVECKLWIDRWALCQGLNDATSMECIQFLRDRIDLYGGKVSRRLCFLLRRRASCKCSWEFGFGQTPVIRFHILNHHCWWCFWTHRHCLMKWQSEQQLETSGSISLHRSFPHHQFVDFQHRDDRKVLESCCFVRNSSRRRLNEPLDPCTSSIPAMQQKLLCFSWKSCVEVWILPAVSETGRKTQRTDHFELESTRICHRRNDCVQ